MSQPTSILLVDDHALLREALKSQLAAEFGMKVVGTAGNGDDAVTQAKALRPDIVLMDIDMPGQVCFEAARAIKALSPATRVIYLSSFCQDRYIEQALSAHAMGYITKEEPPDVVVKAIRRVASGIGCFSPRVRSRIVFDQDGPRLSRRSRSRASQLTRREKEVLCYLARGMAKKEIALAIHIAHGTVNIHTASLMKKLDIHDRVDLARFAIREGLVEA